MMMKSLYFNCEQARLAPRYSKHRKGVGYMIERVKMGGSMPERRCVL